MKYYFEPENKYYNTRQELVDAWNATFEVGIDVSRPATIEDWTEEQWETNWVKR